MDKLMLPHDGYHHLKPFQLARLIFNITVRFCDRFVSKFSQTHDQMIQAARSCVQNIAEGGQTSGTQKKSGLKFTNVARTSLEELRLDYEDFLRQNHFSLWEKSDTRQNELIAERINTVNQFAFWVKRIVVRDEEHIGAIAANGVLVLLSAVRVLLNRHDAQAGAPS